MGQRRNVIGEDLLIDACSRTLQNVAIYVGRNVVVNGLELDLISLIPEESGLTVHVFEAKSKPKFKLIKQLGSRHRLTDYLYVILPYTLYSWAMSFLPSYVGVVVVDANLIPHLVRLPKWLGNGERLLKIIIQIMTKQHDLIAVRHDLEKVYGSME